MAAREQKATKGNARAAERRIIFNLDRKCGRRSIFPGPPEKARFKTVSRRCCPQPPNACARPITHNLTGPSGRLVSADVRDPFHHLSEKTFELGLSSGARIEKRQARPGIQVPREISD